MLINCAVKVLRAGLITVIKSKDALLSLILGAKPLYIRGKGVGVTPYP
jgi:hypothetical protein